MATSVDYNDIRLHLDDDYDIGTYCTGRPAIKAISGAVGVTRIELLVPERDSGDIAGRDGFMVSPEVTRAQAFDDRAAAYAASLLPSLPVSLGVGDTLIATESDLDAPDTTVPKLERIAYFHVVEDLPDPKDFAPHPYGPDPEQPSLDEDDINTSHFDDNPVVGVPPTVAAQLASMEYPVLRLFPQWDNNTIYARTNMPQGTYGREIGRMIGACALSFLLDQMDAGEKLTMAKRFVQQALDYYGYVRMGGDFRANGGHMMGPKVVIVVGGHLVDYAPMRDIGNTFLNGEDSSTFYVTPATQAANLNMMVNGSVTDAASTTLTISGATLNQQYRSTTIEVDDGDGHTEKRVISSVSGSTVTVTAAWSVTPSEGWSWRILGYEDFDVGTPEWRSNPFNTPNPSLFANYRDNVVGTHARTALAVAMHGLQSNWGHNPYFDVVARHLPLTTLGVDSMLITGWTRVMCDEYWDDAYTAPPPSPSLVVRAVPRGDA